MRRYRDSYGVDDNFSEDPMPTAKAGKNFPEPGVSGIKPKYSSGKDPMIGRYRGNGLVNDDADTPTLSQSESLKTGLKSRQPI